MHENSDIRSKNANSQMQVAPAEVTSPLVDTYGRAISYLRVSVTDRCDFRCTYCMSENMQFLPRKDLLTFEEIMTITNAFMRRGVKKIRLTGGEPLVRRDVMDLIKNIGAHVGDELEELTLTTNGSQLRKFAHTLKDAGVRRINVSMDSLDPNKFADITRRGKLDQVLDGIDAADEAGLKIKINMVALKGFNDSEIEPMMHWAHGRGFGLTLIEGMPLGDVSMSREDSYLPLKQVHDELAGKFTLKTSSHKTGGPARYKTVAETGGLIGFITPMSHNFCESCNRVRLSATGQLYLCLGQEDKVDLRTALRDGGPGALDDALDHAMIIKPKGHDFDVARAKPAVQRHMSATGG